MTDDVVVASPAPVRLVLASSSPRRRELLGRLGIAFDVVEVDVDETPLPQEVPTDYVRRVAGAKADVVGRPSGAVVVAADTTIELDGAILGKPLDPDDAAATLVRLAGRRHQVHTAIVLRHGSSSGTEGRRAEVVTTHVEMMPADRRLIDWYVATGEPLDKAGSYAIQGAGDLFVSRIEGSVSNVIGLPLTTLVAMLDRVSGANWFAGR